MPRLSGCVHPVRLLPEIYSVHDVVNLRENDDFLITFACLHIVWNELQCKLIKNNAVTNPQDCEKHKRRKRREKPCEKAVVMGKRMEDCSGGTDAFRRLGAQKEVPR